MNAPVVHQFHSGASAGDAITRQMLQLQGHLRAMGYQSEIFAEHIAPGIADLVRPIAAYEGHPEHLLLVHHSMGYDAFGDVVALPDRLVLVYHNITPEHFFSSPLSRLYVRMGRAQLDILADRCSAAIADSNHNRKELLDIGLRRVTVLPVRTDFADLHHPTWHPPLRWSDWLFVGRLVASKCQVELVDAFARFARRHPLANLILVGDISDGDYVREVVGRATELGIVDRMRITGKLTDAELLREFHRAGVYMSLSEHEGFGVPLLEAMAAELPVLAYRAGAVAETMAGAGILLDDKDPDRVAALASVVLADPDLRQRLVARQLRRIRQIEGTDVEAALRSVIDEALTGQRPLSVQLQGPFETSYSLASLNRHLAVELARQPGLDVSIYATEGPGDYTPDPADLREHPVAAALYEKSASAPDPDVVIRQMYPPRVHDSPGGLTLQYFGWEESRLPPEHVEQFNRHLDGIGTMSQYVADLLVDSGVTVPIEVMGVGVEPHDPTAMPAQPEVSDLRSTVFLHIGSALPRKGVDVLLRAYFDQFTGADDVTLVVKSFPNPHNVVGLLLERLGDEHPDPPDVRWIDRDLPHEEIRSLYNVASCYVHPARGEGFGLPVAEAMLARVPVIAVAHSGLADFCSAETVETVPFSLHQSDTHVSVAGSLWAEPDQEALGDRLRAFADGPTDRALIEARVDRAERLIQESYSWSAVASRWRGFIEHVELAHARPRVALVSTFNSRCGIAEYSRYLVDHTPGADFEVHADVLAIPLDRDAERSIQRTWYHRWTPDLTQLRSALNRSPAEVLHLQFNFGFFELERLGVLLEDQLPKRRIILTMHSTEDVEMEGRMFGLADIAGPLRRVDAIVVHQSADAARLADVGVSENVHLLPHGTVEARVVDRDAVRKVLGIADRPVIGTFGFLLPHKGTLELIRAVDLLRNERPNILLLAPSALHPDSRSRAYLEECQAEIEQRGLHANVRLITDFLPDDVARAFLVAADVIVLPYQETQESASGALRFALTAGRPIVVSSNPVFTDAHGAVDVLDDTSPEAMAAAIDALLLDAGALDELARRSRQLVRSTSWDRTGRQHRSLYTGGRGPRAGGLPPLEEDLAGRANRR